ncbi:MAG TPA: hypothetical protein VLL06_10450, partial [Nitrospiraceae bacterium]|nr:hypothetical protein [Nitrospiraceae bacterium]
GTVVLDRVDRDSDEAHALFDESIPRPCIRGQLPVAVRSPISAVKDDQDRSAGQMFSQVPGLAVLVR